MKNSTKLKIWGFSQLVLAIILIILGAIVFRDRSWDSFAWKPNFIFFVPGMFLLVLTVPILISGFGPQITKFGSKLQSETIDYAGQDMKEAISKSADTVVTGVTPSLKSAFSEMGFNTKTSHQQSKEEQLIEAKKLLNQALINEVEYQQMRKNILGIKD
jgi:hypothetical protein